MFQGNSQKELYRVKVEDCRQDHMVIDWDITSVIQKLDFTSFQ